METDSPEKTDTLNSDKNYHSQNYHSLNAMLNLFDDDGLIQFDKDREAVRQYFLQHESKIISSKYKNIYHFDQKHPNN